MASFHVWTKVGSLASRSRSLVLMAAASWRELALERTTSHRHSRAYAIFAKSFYRLQ
jgi:hypothetical protein